MTQFQGVLERRTLDELQAQIDALRDAGEDYLILAVGVRGSNLDCPQGNAVATVRIGDDEATSEALHLQDAIALARGKILRERKAREDKRRKEQEERAARKAA